MQCAGFAFAFFAACWDFRKQLPHATVSVRRSGVRICHGCIWARPDNYSGFAGFVISRFDSFCFGAHSQNRGGRLFFFSLSRVGRGRLNNQGRERGDDEHSHIELP